jgi:hypothetical protein
MRIVTILLRNRIVTGFVLQYWSLIVFLHAKRNYGNNARLLDGVAEAAGRTGTAHLRHEDDE